MIYRLRDKNRPLPNGVSVYDQHTGYRAAPFTSYTEQVNGVMNARLGNPGNVARYKLPVDYDSCADFVDRQLGRIAFDHQWTDFYIATSGEQGGSPAAAPFPRRSPVARVAGVAKAAVLSVQWIESGAEAVVTELSTKRAETCAACPKNETGDWLSTFTIPAAAAIRKALEARSGMKLSTPVDDQLGVCQVCDCVTRLLVHVPLQKKLSVMPREIHDALPPNCWVITEEKETLPFLNT